MEPQCPKVTEFYRELICQSGLLVDEDLQFVLGPRPKKKVKGNKGSCVKSLAVAGLSVIAAVFFLRKGKVTGTCAAGAVIACPTISLAFSLYGNFKSHKDKQRLENLVVAFKNLAMTHKVVVDFLKSFLGSIENIKEPVFNSAEQSASDLLKTLSDLEQSLVVMMKDSIYAFHAEFEGSVLNLSDLQQITDVTINGNSLQESISSVYIIEGQVILLRSHLLTIIYVCCVMGKPNFKNIRLLVYTITKGVVQLQNKLDSIRFSAPPSVSMENFKKIMKKTILVPSRIKLNILKLNDRVCCTMLKLKSLIEILDKVESENQLVILEPTVSSVAEELLLCCNSTMDLKKLLEVMNRKRTMEVKKVEHPSKFEEEPSSSNQEETEELQPLEDLAYQLFESGIDGDEYQDTTITMLEESELLVELRQSDAFRKREVKFKSMKVSTPKDLEGSPPRASSLAKCELSSIGKISHLSEIPPPPPPPSALDSNSSLYQSAMFEEPEEAMAPSSLQLSLQNALEQMRIQPRSEDFE